tara:strand:+ start:897 stop:1133 length:237 start_codon:yes stop_codon:yes gene_type:complete
MSKKSFDSLSKQAQDRQHDAFVNLLEAIRRYRAPLPMLSTYHSKEARMMKAFLEVLIDQLYPREIWEKYLDEMPSLTI